MIAGTFLLFLGLSGLALRGRTAEAESDAAPRDRELFKAPAVESTEEFYNSVAKDPKTGLPNLSTIPRNCYFV